MRGILKVECKRYMHGIGILIALLIGIGCIVYKDCTLIRKFAEGDSIIKELGIYESFPKGSFYDIWIVAHMDSTTIYFFYFIGIIVALPYGISYYNDKKSGYIKNICNRVSKRLYLNAKYLAVFISGGIAGAVPIIVDFLFVRIITPVDCFETIENSSLNGITEWHAFILDHPYISISIFCFMWFIFSGVLSSISLMVSAVSNNFFLIQLAPFFVMMIMFYMPTFFGNEISRFMPFYFLTMFGEGDPLTFSLVSVIIMSVTYSVFVIGESGKDTL